MNLDVALAAARKEFDVNPTWDPYSRRMIVEVEGCDTGFDFETRVADAKPGWRCLEGQFTKHGEPRLYELRYTQVVDRDQSRSVTDALVERYGKPEVQVVERENAGWFGAPKERLVRLAWGAKVGTDDDRRALEADVEVKDGKTVLRMSLTRPELRTAAQNMEHHVRF